VPFRNEQSNNDLVNCEKSDFPFSYIHPLSPLLDDEYIAEETMFFRSSVVVLALVSGVEAFAPSNPLKTHVTSTSNLHMSAALIVQNKGGGHGELGT